MGHLGRRREAPTPIQSDRLLTRRLVFIVSLLATIDEFSEGRDGQVIQRQLARFPNSSNDE